MIEKLTERGFQLIEFIDHNDNKCSLQASSLATEDAIWLGIDKPKIVEDGWHPQFPARTRDLNLGGNAYIFGRMHLTRKQVANLLPYLKRFVETGELR